MLLHQTLQPTAGGYYIYPRQFLIEIAEQGYSIGFFLYLIDEQKNGLATVLLNMILQTEILPEVIDIAETPENNSVFLLQIKWDKRVELLTKFSDKCCLAHLSRSPKYQRLPTGIIPPTSQLPK